MPSPQFWGILEEIQNTGYLDAQWPDSWSQVKRELETMEEHYILGHQYLKTAKCRYDCGSTTTTAYHIFVRIPKQGELPTK